ncbi:MAG TPA: HAMP domain-containing sensor histidine kinase [Longimicrobiales bacterium]|nr:HAMP domain-containing sensor histidine kinase [Longimicrobiales bacterium]
MAGARPHRRQVVLFLSAVVLPSAVLVVVGLQLISQERKLQRSRLAEDRRAAVMETAGIVREALREVETRALERLRAGEALASRGYGHPAVRLVARVEDGTVVPPWEDDPALAAARRELTDSPFTAIVRDGERAEFGQGDSRGAARRYRGALAVAEGEAQSAFARLLLARALASFDRPSAEEEYLRVLALPEEAVDENGVPFALYAAVRLREWGAAENRVSAALANVATAKRWRTPGALYLLEDLLPGDTTVDATRSEVASVLSLLEQSPVVLAAGLDPGDGATDWVGVGSGDWLATPVGSAGDAPEGVVAVSASALADHLNRIGLPARDAVGSIRVATAEDQRGVPLGVARPDLLAVLEDAPGAAGGSVIGLRSAFYGTALLLVIGTTLLGGYLLLRDTRRETHTARLRSDFVSSVSHELKTPLTAIRMFAETLRERDSVDPATRTEYLDTIVGESERLTRLIANVLDLSKIEQGQKAYVRAPASLEEIVGRATRAVEYPLELEGFQLSVDIDADLPPVNVDADSVEQAVLNLLTNAMKYSESSRDIVLGVHRRNGQAVISVTDFGIGIPREEAERLTKKFYRVPSPENGRVPGTGLGLTIVEHAARAHGGHLTVESEPGRGSTFSIHLPLEESA